MNLYDQFTASTASGVTLTEEDAKRCTEIMERVPGWSDGKQYAFFKILLEQGVTRILVAGVYRGRDIAFLVDLINRYHAGKDIKIVGVDRFTADPCGDWPKTNAVTTWEQAVLRPPPSYEESVKNTASPHVEIVKSDDFAFLDTTDKRFDAVYLDTSHDFNTLIRQFRQVPGVCMEDAIVCGDDYADSATWGVKSAVNQATDTHTLFADWIWVTGKSNIKKI